jgi:glucosamine-phosphate N-acetyltransferase
MLIRDCTPDDFPSILPLLEQLWPDIELDGAALEAVFLGYLATDSDHCFGAFVEGGMAGFCSMNVKNSLWRAGKVAYVDNLVVDEAARRMGLGAALVGHAESVARGLGCKYLELDSGFQRPWAHDFYAEQGFEKFGFIFGKRL